MWSIKEINIKEWDNVSNDKQLLTLNDDAANYGILVQRTKNALNSARLQYQQNQTQIEQWITNSRLALERSRTALNTAQSVWAQNIRWAENTLDSSDTQKNSLLLQMKSEKNKLENFLGDVLHKNDEILWVTTQYKTSNDDYEIYLSAKNTSFKLTAKTQLSSLYKQRNKLKALNTSNDISVQELKNNIEIMDNIYSEITNLLDTMDNVLIKSVSSTTFSQTTIDWLIAANNWLQTASQTNFTYFTQFKQQADSAIINNWDWFVIAWNESSEIGYQNTITSTQQQISDAKIWLETAEANYQTALKNKNSSLWLSSTNITSAQLAYQEALKQYQKLTITAPFTGTVWKILIDKGQDVSIWTPLLTLINKSDPIVEIWITASEYSKINSWSIVEIDYRWEIFSWDIVSLSSQAWSNGLYNVIIKLNQKIDIIWGTATIKISSKTNKITVPLNIVNPLDKNNWYIYILSGWQPETLNINLWEIRWDQIEILSEISPDTKIITNNIANYNPNIHELVQK
jgi:multidrug resistance efflux pump